MTDGAVLERVDAPVRAPLRNRATLLVLLVLLLVFALPVVVAVLLGAEPYTRIFVDDPGRDVTIVTTLLTAVAQGAGLVTTGALVHLLFLRDATARRARFVPRGFEASVLRTASGIWTAAAAGLIVFEALDANGAPLVRLANASALPYLWDAGYAPKAWTISFLAGLLILLLSFFAEEWTGLLIPLWASAIALLAPVVSGQVLVGPNHDFGGDAAVLQTIAENVFFGAIVVALLRILTGRLVSPLALRRLFRIGLVALPVIVLTELVITLFTLAGTSAIASATGWFRIGRFVLLLVLIVVFVRVGRLSRRGLLRAHIVTRAMTIGAVAVAGWIGLAVALTRQPPPQYFVPTSIEQIFMGFEVPDAPSIVVLFTQWRPNILFLVLAAAAVTVYLVAVRTLRRRGDHWSRGRTAAWILGWTIVVFVTSSGFGKYSAPDFGVHMIVHMSLNMLAPGLLVLGGVVTLLLRASVPNRTKPAGLHDWVTAVLHWPVLRALYSPLIVFVVYIGSYYGLYLTPLFGDFMRFHWAHQLMNLHFLIVGYLYYSLSIGVDRPPRPLPHIGKLGYVLAAMPFHAFFGVILMTSNSIIAETFYSYLSLPWADLQAQQYLAGGVAWAGGEIPLMIVVVILGIQWSRQDAREARRKDRHIDTGRDDEFDAYNRMLQRLASRDAGQPAPRPVPPKEPQS